LWATSVGEGGYDRQVGSSGRRIRARKGHRGGATMLGGSQGGAAAPRSCSLVRRAAALAPGVVPLAAALASGSRTRWGVAPLGAMLGNATRSAAAPASGRHTGGNSCRAAPGGPPMKCRREELPRRARRATGEAPSRLGRSRDSHGLASDAVARRKK
jgi:hypothetical protein